jgi:hypothetical protein
MLSLVALAVSALPVPPAVRAVAGSRRDRGLTAVAKWGETYLTARETRVDVDFPSGKTGKAVLFVLFEPSTGYYLHTFNWAERDYPEAWWNENEVSHWRAGVAADRLFAVGGAGGRIGILDSSEKAASMDDAEAKTLRLISDHLAEVEARSGSYRPKVTNLEVGRGEFPQGFFRSQMDPRPGLPLEFLGLVSRDDSWELTLESTETHQKATLLITPRKIGWTRGPVQVEKVRHQEQ